MRDGPLPPQYLWDWGLSGRKTAAPPLVWLNPWSKNCHLISIAILHRVLIITDNNRRCNRIEARWYVFSIINIFEISLLHLKSVRISVKSAIVVNIRCEKVDSDIFTLAILDIYLVCSHIKFYDWIILIKSNLNCGISSMRLAIILESKLRNNVGLEMVNTGWASSPTIPLGLGSFWAENCCSTSCVIEPLIRVIVP